MSGSDNKKKNLKKLQISKRVVVHGAVQGVGFRYSMCGQAESLGVTGWVRNRGDGTVEAVVHGDPVHVDEMIAWVKKGPSGAQVTDVEISDGEGEFNDFSIDASLDESPRRKD